MKILRILMVVSAAFFVVPAQAQTSGTVTNHAFAIGKGAGQTGFTSLLCAATQLAVGQTAANPACKTLSGDLTMDADGVTVIGANKVTDGMLRQSGALSLIGRSANSTGNVADISAVAGSGCAYREASNVIGCGELATTALGANIVTNAKLAQMANGTTKCRTTSGTGNAEDCTASQMRSLLSLVVGTNVQAWDADLDALAALTGTGIVRRTGSATFTTGTAVANSELATMANGTIKGNVSGSSATPSDITPSQALDVIGTTRGSILYRGASGWAILTPGTSGQVVTSNGAGSDPSYQDAAGGSGGSDTDRRNALLTLIYQSKLFASYRRVINTFAAGFKSSDGINAGSSSNYTVDTTNGNVAPSVAGGSTGTFSLTPSTGVTLGSGVSSNHGFQFTSPATSTIAQIKINIRSLSTSGTLTASLYTNNSGSPGTQVGASSSTITVSSTGDKILTFPSPPSITSGSVYWMVLSIGGSLSGTLDRTASTAGYKSGRSSTITSIVGDDYTDSNTLRLQIDYGTGGVNNMAVVTAAQTADASVSNARVLIEFDNAATPTLNSDLTAEVTCDGGSNWASSTLSAVTSNSQGGRKIAETADTTCTAGTSFAARIKTLNNKNVPIYGVSVAVH